MPLHLQQISIPYIQASVSDIWKSELVFEKSKYYHIRASSGSGKSTFMHTLYGIQKNFQGKYVFNDKDIKSLSQDEWCSVRSKQLSIVFQDLKLFEDKTALQNLQIKNDLTKHTTEQNILFFAEKLKVTHTLQRNINTLSYGERQRIAIIRSLLQPFEYILLDEPFSHLDNENIKLASALILEEAKKRNAAIILCDLESDTHFPYDHFLNL